MTDRRHNDPQSPHERARLLASDRLGGPLTATDAIWLDDHLHDCDECRSVAAAYAEDRELLRSLPMPQPPRDLWARTSVRLERERAAGRGATARRSGGVGWRFLPALVAVALVAVVVGRSMISSGPTATPGIGLSSPPPASSGQPGPTSGAGATPLAVDPGDVAWVDRAADGRYTMNMASVAAVCASDAAPSPDCAPLDQGAKQLVSFDSQPGSVVLDPDALQAAVVESSASTTGGKIFVVPIARATPQPTPSATPSPTPSVDPSASASVGPSAAVTEPPAASPTATALPTNGAGSSASPSTEPSTSAEPTPTAEPSVAPTGSPVPSGTPSQTAATTLAIISDVIVVGGDAAYSPTGDWLAFSARKATGSDGPDVYVWHTGDDKARAVTKDHASVFSSWVDDRILASRASAASTDGSADATSPSPDPATSDAPTRVPTSFLIDPASGKEVGPQLGGVWRPVVDPSGRWMVYWTGTLTFDPTSRTWTPADGRLVIDRWPAPDSETYTAADPQPLLSPKAGEPVMDWEVRWDPTGRIVGVWVGDALDPALGRLSLVAVDHATGLVDSERKPVLRDAPALPGFAIGDGRIAWASPPGQDGEGSRLLVLAWKGPDAGRTRTEPASSLEDIIVVR
jgi:hypothetical protein